MSLGVIKKKKIHTIDCPCALPLLTCGGSKTPSLHLLYWKKKNNTRGCERVRTAESEESRMVEEALATCQSQVWRRLSFWVDIIDRMTDRRRTPAVSCVLVSDWHELSVSICRVALSFLHFKCILIVYFLIFCMKLAQLWQFRICLKFESKSLNIADEFFENQGYFSSYNCLVIFCNPFTNMASCPSCETINPYCIPNWVYCLTLTPNSY